MAHLEYALLLAAAWASVLWTDLHFGLGIARQRRRLLGTLAVCLAFCLAWDSLGVHQDIWSSNPHRVLGIWVLPGVPLEEVFLLGLIVYVSIVLWQIAQRSWAAGKTKSDTHARLHR
jgi:lycopene cyclase domain-containing protein